MTPTGIRSATRCSRRPRAPSLWYFAAKTFSRVTAAKSSRWFYGASRLEEAAFVAERLRAPAWSRAPSITGGSRLRCTISAGCASFADVEPKTVEVV